MLQISSAAVLTERVRGRSGQTKPPGSVRRGTRPPSFPAPKPCGPSAQARRYRRPKDASPHLGDGGRAHVAAAAAPQAPEPRPRCRRAPGREAPAAPPGPARTTPLRARGAAAGAVPAAPAQLHGHRQALPPPLGSVPAVVGPSPALGGPRGGPRGEGSCGLGAAAPLWLPVRSAGASLPRYCAAAGGGRVRRSGKGSLRAFRPCAPTASLPRRGPVRAALPRGRCRPSAAALTRPLGTLRLLPLGCVQDPRRVKPSRS